MTEQPDVNLGIWQKHLLSSSNGEQVSVLNCEMPVSHLYSTSATLLIF